MQVAGTRASDRTSWQRRTTIAGLIGAIVFITGVAAFLAMHDPPYQQDESSHLGYALSLRQGELPTITTPVETEGGGEHLRIALRRPFPFSDPQTHVANNPPFVYLASLPLVELGIRSGITDGGLLALRFVDVLGAVAAIAIAYLLGRELAGNDRFVGLVTAGLLSSVIAISLVTSVANVDGPALVATTGVTWMMARFARTRSMRDAMWLGCWCAGAAAVRPMSLAFAAVAGALALFLGWRARGNTALVPLIVRLAAPTVVLTGWFYALNWHRYGDWTGSKGLFDKYGLQGNQSLFTVLRGPEPFVKPFAYLVTEVYGRSPWWLYRGPRHYLITGVAVALVVAAIVLAARSSRERPPDADARAHATPTGSRLSLAAWVCVAILALVPIVLTAQHMSGGGAGHARYLFPMLPICAAAAALVMTRINRWLSVVVVALFALAQITRIRAAGNIHDGGLSIRSPQIRHAIVDQPFLALSVIAGIAGAVVLLGALIRLAAEPNAADPDMPEPQPAEA